MKVLALENEITPDISNSRILPGAAAVPGDTYQALSVCAAVVPILAPNDRNDSVHLKHVLAHGRTGERNMNG